MNITEYVDTLTRLCLQGHASYARTHATAMIEFDPLAGQLGLATVAAAALDHEGQRRAVEAARALAPRQPAVLEARAVLAATTEDPDAAVEAARAVVAAESSPRALNGLARALFASGRIDDAERTWEGLVQEFGDADAHVQLAANKSDERAVLDHLVAAFFASPKDDRPFQQLVQIWRERSWPIGLAIYARHMRSRAETPRLKFVADVLGLAAVEFLRATGLEGLAQAPPSAHTAAVENAKAVPVAARMTLAGLLIDQGHLDAARDLLESIHDGASTEHERSGHEFLAGRLAQAKSDAVAAARHYRAALGFDSDNLDAACNLVDLLIGSQSQPALADAEKIVTGIPEIMRRSNTLMTYNEAALREALGDQATARELVRFLFETPLGHLLPAVEAMYRRLDAKSE